MRSSSVDHHRPITNHPSGYYRGEDGRAIPKSSSLAVVEGRHEITPGGGHVKQLGKALEKSIIIPQYSHRVGSKPISSVSRVSAITRVSESDEEEIEWKAGTVLSGGSELLREISQRIDELATDSDSSDIDEAGNAFLLSPHRFGSIDVGQPGLLWNEDDESSTTSSRTISDAESEDEEVDGWRRNRVSNFFPKIDSESQGKQDDFVDFTWNEKKHPPPQLPPTPANLTKEQQKRRYIMENILSTEASYVQVLQSLVHNYEMDLYEKYIPIISHKDTSTIFHKLRNLLEIHRSFQIQLTECARCWDNDEMIGGTFTACFNRETVRDTYASFINNYSIAMEMVKELSRTNKRFEAFLNEKQKLEKSRLPLIGLMVKPIQRFPQFIMLLQDLLKHTPESHRDFHPLQHALSEIELLANYLNNRKKEFEQELEASKFLNELSKSRYTLPEAKKLKILGRIKVLFNRYSKKGKLKYQSEQELVLFNNMLLCCTETSPDQYKLEWYAPLDVINVHDHFITPDLKTSIVEDANQQFLITSYNNNIAFSAADANGKVRLRELQSLIHDHTVLTKVSSLATSLKYSYRGFDEITLQSICNNLQLSIQQRVDENRLMDSSLLSLKVYSGKKHADCPTTYIFQLPSPEAKNTWIEQFVQAKLSHNEINRKRWYVRDGTVIQNNPILQYIHKPLFLTNSAIDVSRNLGEVNCAVPVCLVYGNILKRFLWCCHANAGITIISIYNHTPTILQNFRCESFGDDLSFWCVEMIPGLMSAMDPLYQADMVWVGTNSNIILVYSLLEEDRTNPFLQIETDSPIISLCYDEDRVYGGLLNGSICIFARTQNGEWESTDPIEIGENAVIKILKVPKNDTIIAACDNRLITLNWQEENLLIDSIALEPPNDVRETIGYIQDFVLSSSAAWIAFRESQVIQLINLKTGEIVQSVSLTRTLEELRQTKCQLHGEEDSITCMNIVKDWLLIGTAAGFICKLYIPKFDSCVLRTNSPCSVSLHKHKGAIRFIVSFQNFVERFVESIDIGFDHQGQEGNSSSVGNNSEAESNSPDRIASTDDTLSSKPAMDISSLRRVSMTPLKNKWLSNPNLLLNMQLESEDRTDKENNLNSLMVAFESMEFLTDVSDSATEEASETVQSESQSQSQSQSDGSDAEGNSSQNRSVLAMRETEKQVVLDSFIIVTGGLGYEDLGSDETKDEDIREACLISWCE